MTTQAKSRNPLFLVLAILSALPTLFFLLGFVSGPNVFFLGGFLWSAMWTWVWWSMAGRYR